jgi:hypothetical protein
MSIADKLQQSVNRARALHKRANGDLDIYLGTILADLESDIERVRGLESVAPISGELLKAYQENGGRHDHASA